MTLNLEPTQENQIMGCFIGPIYSTHLLVSILAGVDLIGFPRVSQPGLVANLTLSA